MKKRGLAIAAFLLPTLAHTQGLAEISEMTPLGSLLLIAVVVVIWAVLFLLFRQVVLWYFRVNQIVELLTDIRNSLKRTEGDVTWACPKCGSKNSNDSYNCAECGYSLR